MRGETPPEPMPFVSLVSPSGEVWTYGESQQSNFIQGDAVEFAQVVTQTRNIGDTSLNVVGDPATDWMSRHSALLAVLIHHRKKVLALKPVNCI